MRKFFSVLLVLVFMSVNTVSAYSAERYSDSNYTARLFAAETLAPTLKMGPVYSFEKGDDGFLKVVEPSDDQKEELHTEIILAILAQSVHNNAAAEDLDGFINTYLGGNDFQKCRVAHVRKVKDGYIVLYFNKDPEAPRVCTVGFSELADGESIDRDRGAIIELANGKYIKMQVLSIGEGYETIKKMFFSEGVEGYTMMLEISQAVAVGVNAAGSIERLFTDASFQDIRLDVLEAICNRLLDGYREGKVNKESFETFLKAVKQRIVEFSANTEMSQAVQLMSGQAFTIMSWYDRGLTSAGNLEVSSQAGDMVRNEKRGISMISAQSVGEDISEVKNEGEAGLYWRGTEKLKKLGDNVAEGMIYSEDRYNSSKENMVMYLMDHGFIPVPEDLVDATNEGRISTIHETFFLNDTLPGSSQTTSTGSGHFQGLKVDVKQVTEGSGVQVNVRYNADGEIEEIILQIIKEGDWALALPGSVDYMINLGGLRFNDMSIALDPEDARVLNPDFDFSEQNLVEVEAAIAEKGGIAPYLAAADMPVTTFVPNMTDMPKETWLGPLFGFATDMELTGIYERLNKEKLDEMVETLKEAQSVTRNLEPDLDIAILEEKVFKARKEIKGPSLGKLGTINKYFDMNVDLVADMLGSQALQDILIRVPIEAIEAIGAESLTEFLSAVQKTPHGYVELYSSEGIAEVSQDVYEKYGLEKKAFDQKRTRENTVTMMSVLKGEDFTAKGRPDGEWHIGDIKPTDTIISPIGMNYDRTGFVRGAVFGLRLAEIARQINRNGNADETFVKSTIDNYRVYCEAMGVKRFDLEEQDILNIVQGNINVMAQSLKRLIKLLPISPVNAEELRQAYEHAREAMIAA